MLSIRTEVANIYELQKRGDLAPYAKKVERVRRSGALGITFVPRADSQPGPIYIRKEWLTLDTVGFVAYDLINNRKIGLAEVSREWGGRIKLHSLENLSPQTHKNVGVVLIKAILQDDKEGRMYLTPVDNTASYYSKLGFRAKKADMYLPDDARALWFLEIAQNPIDFRL